jgi:tripartite-type tricarboxylate transporter receptor subunit TctC
MLKQALCALAVPAALIATTASAADKAADAYPAQPIRFLVPNPPGGGSDAVARILATELSKNFGQQVVVDNRGGGGGIIANETAARATPDGYTMLLGFIGPMVITPAMLKTPYDSLKDYAPVSLVAAGQYMLVLHPSVPAKTLKEFVAYAKANPTKLNYGSAGNGSPLHLAPELFKARAGIEMAHVPYKGGGPATAAVLGGEVQVLFGSITSVLPQVKAGKLTPIGVTGAKRSPIAPEYPTIAELGYPGFEMTSWYGVLLPAKTPPAIVNKLNAAIVEALKNPEVVEQMKRQGMDTIGNSPAEFSAYLKTETEKWAKVVKAAGIKPD